MLPSVFLLKAATAICGPVGMTNGSDYRNLASASPFVQFVTFQLCNMSRSACAVRPTGIPASGSK
jgi:hypothetical protein